MRFDEANSDSAILEELGARIARCRLNQNLTQEAFAELAGVSRPTVARLELGHSTTLSNLIRILRALNLVKNLDTLVPEPPISPIQQLKTKKQQRVRASRASAVAEKSAPWKWGDEE
jgi:transcriptional regulator with XRE-family HTH domain